MSRVFIAVELVMTVIKRYFMLTSVVKFVLYLQIIGAWWLLEEPLKNTCNTPCYLLQAQIFKRLHWGWNVQETRVCSKCYGFLICYSLQSNSKCFLMPRTSQQWVKAIFFGKISLHIWFSLIMAHNVYFNYYNFRFMKSFE